MIFSRLRTHLPFYGRMYSYLKPYFWPVLASILVTIPLGAFDAVVALSLRPYADNILVKQSIASVAMVPFYIVGAAIAQGFFNYSSIYLNGWVGMRVLNDMRAQLFAKLQTMDVGYFDTTSSGNILHSYFSDPEILQASLVTTTKDLLIKVFSSVSLIIVLLTTSWKLGIIAVTVLLCTLYPSTYIRQKIRKLNDQLVSIRGDLLSFYTETTQGIRIVLGFNHQENRQSQFALALKNAYRNGLGLTRTSAILTPCMHLIASIGIALIIWQGSHMVVSGVLSTGQFVTFLSSLVMLYNPIKNLGNTFMASTMALMAAERIFKILDTQPNIQDQPDAKELVQISRDIRFNQVGFFYKPEQPVLHNIDLVFHVGETVAIVGNSGGGKSTIAALIPRFYDVSEGSITIDGHDIRDFKMQSLRDHIALVMQDTFLFNGTIADNLRVGKANATDQELMTSLEKAYLKEFVEEQPLGLATPIGERGVLLSGGQRQRIAIARAFLKNAPLVILDEATSALDNKSEIIVQQALEDLMKNRTVIMIAHRLSTLRKADRIVVLDSGRVVEEGTQSQLLALNGVFATLYHMQGHSAAALIP
jgi:ATP-binding cassette, subfamily B, bacterial MsbA